MEVWVVSMGGYVCRSVGRCVGGYACGGVGG